jgi:hypothetical protein
VKQVTQDLLTPRQSQYLAWRHNPAFNYGGFATIRSQAGLNSYKLSVKEWVAQTRAIGLLAKAGRYGGTYAQGVPQSERLKTLNQTAIQQMQLLLEDRAIRQLEEKE